jgi:hypothetical protein
LFRSAGRHSRLVQRAALRQQIPESALRRVAAAPLRHLFRATSFSAHLFYETVMG